MINDVLGVDYASPRMKYFGHLSRYASLSPPKGHLTKHERFSLKLNPPLSLHTALLNLEESQVMFAFVYLFACL